MASRTAWPRLKTEVRPWTPRISPELAPSRLRRTHAGSYRAAVVPLISDATPLLSSDVAALAEEAAVEVARFDAELGADIAPFASVLLRSESTSSSMIENLSSGAKAIALAELGSTEKRNASEIVGNVAAMRAAVDLADRMDADGILSMHTALVGELHPEIAGRWREEQVWIGGTSFGPHEAVFVPPHHEHVATLIDDLVTFTRRADLPLLAHAALAHAQFETIHPFLDGNGRTGRALIHAMLRGHGLTRNVTVPVSAGLLTDTTGYFDSLTAYRAGDPSAIVRKLAEASFAATINGRQLVAELRTIRAAWDERVKARAGALAWRLADVLLRQPVVNARLVAAELGIGAQNAQRAISPLVAAGVLTEFTGLRRNRMWQATAMLEAVDAFAARAQRRA